MKSFSLKVFTFYKLRPLMPQMAPMNWLSLFLFFNLLLVFSSVKIHFNV